jgi:hypothetical protein
MPERDRQSSAERGLQPDSRTDIGSDLRESTFQLIETLQFHLDRMRTIQDSRASEIANLCQAELDNIRRLIGEVGEEEGPGNSG